MLSDFNSLTRIKDVFLGKSLTRAYLKEIFCLQQSKQILRILTKVSHLLPKSNKKGKSLCNTVLKNAPYS